MNEVPAQLQAGNAEAIFTAALDLPPAERPAHLDAACGNNVALRQRIEALLRAHDGATGFLPEAPKNQATVLLPATEKLGDKIGHYRLREKIGEGGCGIVYVAEQEEPVRRKVALKVIKLGMDTREVVARFEAERQALALMDHPNIARVFDGGATDTGRPYFVLELVRGIRITDFCDQHQLPTVERLKLFIQVCHAIQHAHQKGIIHRDIKPSNILVSLHDDVPVPKVIDFGIAKAVGERLTDKTLYTRFEQFMGTPAYMSPEQARRSDLDIDTRSDIYALGVLLYELLAGRPPFDARQLAESGLEEMVRCIREEEPLRPSTRLSRLQTDELTTTAQRRGTEPPKLINLLRGDLDWIVMKCLEKNRTRRYEAATGLARDIERYLSHEPITARPPSTAYRVEKFVRRNKMMVAAGSAVAAALVLGIIGSTWQAVRATRAEREQSRLRKQAQAQAYASDMKAAQVALQQNNRGLAVSLLLQHLPRPGEDDLRGIEWRYLWQECRPDDHRNFAHPAGVYGVALSPDGQHLATVSWDDKARIWDVASARPIREFESGGLRTTDTIAPRKAVGFSPDGRRLATLGTHGVEIRETAAWSVIKTLESATAPFCFSPDGEMLVTGGTNGMLFWNQADWNCRVLTNVFATGNNLEVSAGGRQLACYYQESEELNTSLQSRVEWWDVHTGARRVIEGTYDVCSLAISPDGMWLAFADSGGELCFWDLAHWVPVVRFHAHEGSVFGLTFSPDSRRLATGGSDQQIHIWEVGTTNKLSTRRGHLGEIASLGFSEDAKTLVSSSMDGTAKIWNLRRGSARSQSFAIATNSVILGTLPGRNACITADYRAKRFQIWSMPEGQSIRTMQWSELDPEGHGFRDAIPDPGCQSMVGVTTNGTVHFFQPATGAIQQSIQIPQTGFTIWSVSPDHRWLLGCSSNMSAGLLLDLHGQVRVQEIPDYYPVSGFSAFSWNSRWLAYAATNFVIKIRDLEANCEAARLKGHGCWPYSLGFSPDGRWLASGGADGGVWLWSLETFRPLFDAPFKGHRSKVMNVAFSSDSRTLATFGDRTMRWWNMATGREMLVFQSEWEFAASPFDFAAPESSNGRFLLFYERQGEIRVAEVPSLAEIDAAEAPQAKGVQTR